MSSKKSDKYYFVKRTYGSKFYQSLSVAKNNVGPNEEIIELVPTGSVFTIEDLKLEAKRKSSLNAVLDGTEQYPNKHHKHMIDLIEAYNKKGYYGTDSYYCADGDSLHRLRKIIDADDFKKYLQSIRTTLLNFICKDVKDYEHVLQIAKFRVVPLVTKPNNNHWNYHGNEEYSFDNNLNHNAKKQFEQAKENIKNNKKKKKV